MSLTRDSIRQLPVVLIGRSVGAIILLELGEYFLHPDGFVTCLRCVLNAGSHGIIGGRRRSQDRGCHK